MANQQCPDGRLVYLHCSSIFSGADAQVRKAKKISQLLQKRKASIKVLTKEFTLPAIAAVAKQLLEEHIFESLPRARLRYPELFQPSEIQEAERAASEAEVLRIEAEAAQDILLTSDDDREDACLGFEQEEEQAGPEGTVEAKTKASGNIQAGAVQLRQVLSGCTLSASQVQEALSIPRLHPVYLPFRTQHKILVFVQHLLEECCFDFGNTWVPDLMQLRKWHEVESIELTQWTQRFMKHAKSLPPSAIKPIAGKSIAQVLVGTNTLRHSAVHRHRTSAAGIVNMLSAAITFAEALNDSKRAKRIAEIKIKLETSIEEIVQHQNLLERKLIDQLEEIARRRAELNRLERSSIDEMLAVDEKQRNEVGNTFESVLIGFQPGSNFSTCNCEPSFDRPRAEFEAQENIESNGTDQQPKAIDALEQDLIHQESPHCEERHHENEGLKEMDSPSQKHKVEGGAGEILEVLKPVSSFERSKEEKQDEKATSSRQIFPTPKEASATDESHMLRISRPDISDVDQDCPPNGTWSLGATHSIPAEAYGDAEEAMLGADFSLVAPKGGGVKHCIGPVGILSEDPFITDEAVSKEDLPEEDKAAQEDTPDDLPATSVIEGSDHPQELIPDQYDKSMQDSANPYLPQPVSDIVSRHNDPTEDAEFFVSPPKSATSSVHGRHHVHPLLPPLQLPLVPSIREGATPEAPIQDGHAITLKIINGKEILRSVVFITASTRTAILKEARAYCEQYVKDDQRLGGVLAKEWGLRLVSLRLDGFDMDISTYEVDDLSFLIETVEKRGIPGFTLRVVEI